MSNTHIFISYRRDDSAGYTRAIYDQLVKRFTQERIFMDVDAIEPGLPFDEVINQAIGRCEVMLVMIGKRWMEQQPGAGPRVNDDQDFVRIEIAAALSRNVRVIPVLLDGADMPTEESLPEALRALARRNAIEISNSRFTSDVDRLVEVVSKVLGESISPARKSRSHKTLLYLLVAMFITVALFSSIAYFNSSLSTKKNNQITHGKPESTAPHAPKIEINQRYTTWEEQLMQFSLESGESKVIKGGDLYAQVATYPRSSCAGPGFVPYTWQIRKPYPGSSDLEVRRVLMGGMTDRVGLGAMGSAKMSVCDEHTFKNNGLEKIFIELRYASAADLSR